MARLKRLLGLVLSRIGHCVLWRCIYSFVRGVSGLCSVIVYQVYQKKS